MKFEKFINGGVKISCSGLQISRKNKRPPVYSEPEIMRVRLRLNLSSVSARNVEQFAVGGHGVWSIKNSVVPLGRTRS